ncbi:MAG: 16S rRNA (uracil(1498)-N(3))-methyltransferase [Burkholderiales bacterium]
MGAPRFHVSLPLAPDDAGREIALPEAAAHHALRVLRLAAGDPLVLFTGAGGEFAATLARADKRSAWARLDAFSAVERESPVAVTLVQALPASDTMDFVVRKAVEMGATAIVPVTSERSARLPAGERGDKRVAHWRQVAVAACEQCGRNRVPEVTAPQPLFTWLAGRAGRPGILLAPEAAAGLPSLAPPDGALDVLIGPEGGWTADEVGRAQQAGIAPVRMGARVLRTETAGIAALAGVNMLWGDMR